MGRCKRAGECTDPTWCQDNGDCSRDSRPRGSGDKTGEGWWCPTCHRSLMPAEVTYNETHDVREGGCGEAVGGAPQSAIAPNWDRNMEGAEQFVEALITGAPIWPNKWGQDVALAAFTVECLKNAAPVSHDAASECLESCNDHNCVVSGSCKGLASAPSEAKSGVRPATLPEALEVLKARFPLSPAERREIDEAVRDAERYRDEIIEECAKEADAKFRKCSGAGYAGLAQVARTIAYSIRALKNAAPQEVRTDGISLASPGPLGVTDEESTRPAVAAPFTPFDEASATDIHSCSPFCERPECVNKRSAPSAELEPTCQRSHPHEMMDPVCERFTEYERRLAEANARAARWEAK